MREIRKLWGVVVLGVAACGPAVNVDDDSGTDSGSAGSSGDTEGPTTSQSTAVDDDDGLSTTEVTTGGSDNTTSTEPGTTSVGSTGSTGGQPEPDAVAEACPDVVQESVYCLTRSFNASWEVVGLDTLATCEVVPSPDIDEGATVARFGNTVVACDDNLVHVYDLSTGDVEATQVPCSGVAEYDGMVMVRGAVTAEDPNDHNTVWVYPLNNVLTGEGPVWSDALDLFFGAEIETDGQTLYATAGGNSVDRFDVAAGNQLPGITLSSFDDGIRGFSLLGEELFVLGVNETIYRYSLDGALLGQQQGDSLSLWNVLDCRYGG